MVKYAIIAAAACLLLATTSTALLPYSTTGDCSPGTCGSNAECTVVSGRPVCSCPTGYIGDPIISCRKTECFANSDCAPHQTCRNEKCVNVCDGACSPDAICDAKNHIPFCSCPKGYGGDPLVRCEKLDPEAACNPSPCGPNTRCQVINSVPTCSCLPGFFGSPTTGCLHECESNTDCGPSKQCHNFKCINPCSQCGENAECETVKDHVAVCKCPKGFFGDPLVGCRPECREHADCPAGRPACVYNSCRNPCEGVCGVGANCELRGITPICSCPRDMTGDPFVRCRPFTKGGYNVWTPKYDPKSGSPDPWHDLCDPNPCGPNARCEPGYDRLHRDRPVCTCHTGYTGDALIGCVRGECTEDSHCGDSQACIEYRCQNPCSVSGCGLNAICTPRRHLAACTCPPGYRGDAITSCHPIDSTPVVARYLRLF